MLSRLNMIQERMNRRCRPHRSRGRLRRCRCGLQRPQRHHLHRLAIGRGQRRRPPPRRRRQIAPDGTPGYRCCGGCATAANSSLSLVWLLTIAGQRRQMAPPCSAYQRQSRRMAQRGRRCTTAGSSAAARSPRLQCSSTKCAQACSAHAPARRSTSPTGTAAVAARSSSEKGTTPAVKATRGRPTFVVWMTPMTCVASSARELGQTSGRRC